MITNRHVCGPVQPHSNSVILPANSTDLYRPCSCHPCHRPSCRRCNRCNRHPCHRPSCRRCNRRCCALNILCPDPCRHSHPCHPCHHPSCPLCWPHRHSSRR